MRSNKKRTIPALTVLAFAVAPACAPLIPPAQNSGQVQSHDGVALAVTEQACSRSPDNEKPGWNLVEERLAIEVRNGSPDSITVHRDRFRLRLQDGGLLETATWGAADPVVVSSGQSRVFKVRFMVNTDVTCQSAMRLDAGRAIAQHEHSVALGGVSFVPRRAL